MKEFKVKQSLKVYQPTKHSLAGTGGNRIEKIWSKNKYCAPPCTFYNSTKPITDTTRYSRDAQGNILAVYNRKNDSVWLKEWDIYGSKRVGVVDTTMLVGTNFINCTCTPLSNPIDSSTIGYLEGQKQYELTNHLGNVLVTVSDKKTAIDTTATPYIANYYEPVIINAQDYYPFGMVEPGRQYSILHGDSCYRYAFNGKLHDDDIYGKDNSYDYGARFYDPRLGRFMSVDPLAKKFPYYSPYMYAGNKPIWAIDMDGLEDVDIQQWNNLDKQYGDKTPTTAADWEKVGDAVENAGAVAMGVGAGITLFTGGAGVEVGGPIFAAGATITDVGGVIKSGAQYEQGEKGKALLTLGLTFSGSLVERKAISALKLTEKTLEARIISILVEANMTAIDKGVDKAEKKEVSPKTNTPGNPDDKGTTNTTTPPDNGGYNTGPLTPPPPTDNKSTPQNSENKKAAQNSTKKDKSSTAAKSSSSSGSSSSSANIPSYNPKSETLE